MEPNFESFFLRVGEKTKLPIDELKSTSVHRAIKAIDSTPVYYFDGLQHLSDDNFLTKEELQSYMEIKKRNILPVNDPQKIYELLSKYLGKEQETFVPTELKLRCLEDQVDCLQECDTSLAAVTSKLEYLGSSFYSKEEEEAKNLEVLTVSDYPVIPEYNDINNDVISQICSVCNDLQTLLMKEAEQKDSSESVCTINAVFATMMQSLLKKLTTEVNDVLAKFDECPRDEDCGSINSFKSELSQMIILFNSISDLQTELELGQIRKKSLEDCLKQLEDMTRKNRQVLEPDIKKLTEKYNKEVKGLSDLEDIVRRIVKCRHQKDHQLHCFTEDIISKLKSKHSHHKKIFANLLQLTSSHLATSIFFAILPSCVKKVDLKCIREMYAEAQEFLRNSLKQHTLRMREMALLKQNCENEQSRKIRIISTVQQLCAQFVSDSSPEKLEQQLRTELIKMEECNLYHSPQQKMNEIYLRLYLITELQTIVFNGPAKQLNTVSNDILLQKTKAKSEVDKIRDKLCSVYQEYRKNLDSQNDYKKILNTLWIMFLADKSRLLETIDTLQEKAAEIRRNHISKSNGTL